MGNLSDRLARRDATGNLFAFLKPERCQSSPAWRRRDAPWSVTIRRTPVLFLRSRARDIAAALNPLFQRSHNSAFCLAVNHIRDVTIAHLPIQQI